MILTVSKEEVVVIEREEGLETRDLDSIIDEIAYDVMAEHGTEYAVETVIAGEEYLIKVYNAYEGTEEEFNLSVTMN